MCFVFSHEVFYGLMFEIKLASFTSKPQKRRAFKRSCSRSHSGIRKNLKTNLIYLIPCVFGTVSLVVILRLKLRRAFPLPETKTRRAFRKL